jgi:hypothetical protein
VCGTPRHIAHVDRPVVCHGGVRDGGGPAWPAVTGRRLRIRRTSTRKPTSSPDPLEAEHVRLPHRGSRPCPRALLHRRPLGAQPFGEPCLPDLSGVRGARAQCAARRCGRRRPCHERARTAFDTGPWPRMSGAERSGHLVRLADELRKRLPLPAQLWTAQVAAPITFAEGLIHAGGSRFDYCSSAATSWPRPSSPT